MRIAVIIPTYNEAKGIGAVLEDIIRVRPQVPAHELHIVVVDGNSPDGTGDVVRGIAAGDPLVHLVVEKEKRGIGMAYATGFTYAMNELHADAIMSFDGDGQHNPADIPRLIEGMDQGYDYVIGSRYVEGGSVPSGWATYRKMLSRYGGMYARFLLRLPVKDVTAGFRLYRVKGFAEFLPVTPETLVSTQYAFCFQYLYEMYRRGAKILEIPIQFREREFDVSKNTWPNILESLRVTGILWARSWRHAA